MYTVYISEKITDGPYLRRGNYRQRWPRYQPPADCTFDAAIAWCRGHYAGLSWHLVCDGDELAIGDTFGRHDYTPPHYVPDGIYWLDPTTGDLLPRGWRHATGKIGYARWRDPPRLRPADPAALADAQRAGKIISTYTP